MRRTPLLLAGALLLATACADDEAAPSATPPDPGTVASAVTVPVVTQGPAVVAPPAGYPAQPDGVPFPGTEWPTASLPAGVDEAALDAAVRTAFGPADRDSGVRSVVVVQGGSIVYERYHPLTGPDEVMSSFSVAKSFTATVVGLLVDEGRLQLDEPVSRPEWLPGDPRHDITLRELLQMSSGLAWDEATSLATLGFTMLASPSAAAVMAAQPLERPPGTGFEYSTGTSALLAGIAADALGGCAALDAFLHERLLDPIGITTEAVMTDGGGCFVGGLGLDMTSRDFARFGLLNLRGGWWDGEQVVPTAWIDAERTPAATNPQYGLHWWVSPSGAQFTAAGLGGQRIAVIPAGDLVIVVNSALGNDGPAATLVSQVADAFGAPV